MRQYDIIPFPELRRQYRCRNRLKRLLAETAIELPFMMVYGITLGLLIMGLWIEI